MKKFANYNFHLFLIDLNGMLDNKCHFCQKNDIDFPIKKGFIQKKSDLINITIITLLQFVNCNVQFLNSNV